MCLAVPGRVESVEGSDPLERRGSVDFGGVRREVQLAFVPEAERGDWVLVHVGFAIARIDEDEAERMLDELERMETGGDAR
ncbi:MAG: HypC/HybG/HupF family hydrogenase formation chaperone [Myxococcota bacterium]|nr:HypC/HybG/HupF family hydrogenase formation chaperone [Myxococcota bacterium]